MEGIVELEVRCCCAPVRLYGYLQVEARYVRPGHTVCFPMRDISGNYGELRLTVAMFSESTAHLQIGDLPEVERSSRLALKYDDDKRSPAEKLATLQRLRGFRPATE